MTQLFNYNNVLSFFGKNVWPAHHHFTFLEAYISLEPGHAIEPLGLIMRRVVLQSEIASSR